MNFQNTNKPLKVVISVGDESGIGPEITLKALCSNQLPKNIEFKFSFCKKLDNVSIDQLIDNLEILKLNNIKNIFLLTPEILNDYYDYLFIISSNKEEVIEENILSNNIGFLIDCNLNFNDGDLNQLLFESYPLI